MKLFSFIFARGGSKGIPNKNIIDFGGIPLISHSINLAKEINFVDRVVVSSDSEDILSIAKDSGAQVIKRPPELSSDEAPEWLAWRHAVEQIKQDEEFDLFLSLPATAPLRSKEDISNCLSCMDDETDIVITVTPSSRSPYFNMVKIGEDEKTQLVIGRDKFSRRQDVPITFDITTVAYLTRPEFIMSKSSIFEGNVKSVIVPKERAVDIDDEIDLLVAKKLLSEKNNDQE